MNGTIAMNHKDEDSMREWLEEVWREAQRVVVVEGGESDVPPNRRRAFATVEDPDLLRLLRAWTTSGRFSGDVCRCPGDLTLALYGEGGRLVGSASVHPDGLSWERSRFHDDLIVTNMVELRLLFSRVGVDGTSRALLGRLISALKLHEGEVQFRPRGDFDYLAVRRVPASLARDLVKFSGEEAANLDGESVERLTRLMLEADQDPETVVRRLFSWLGSVTWPAEAIAGDGVLIRRMIDQINGEIIMRSLENAGDPSELMGVVVWAAFREEDSAVMSRISSALAALFLDHQSA